MDSASAATVSRLCTCALLVAAWRALLSVLSHAPPHPSSMLVAAAAVTVVLARRRGEPMGGPSLNRWDEAIAYLGLASLSRVLGQG